jgi:hypothetical protein
MIQHGTGGTLPDVVSQKQTPRQNGNPAEV